MEHVMFMQKIKEGKVDDYIKAHKNAWPELLTAIKESGIEREMIWINDTYIYLYIMAEQFDKAMANLAEKQVFKDWIKQMEPLFDIMQDYSTEGNIKRLDNVFDLEDQYKKI